MPPKVPLKGGAKAREVTAESKSSGEKVGSTGRSKAAATAKCDGPARNENSAVNSAADAPQDKKATAGAKKVVTSGPSNKSGLRNVPEYDALEYIDLLPEPSQRPASAHHSVIFDDASEDRRPSKKISMRLVATKALGEDVVAAMTADQIADAVVKLDKVRLDDECIDEIDNLEGLVAVTQLQLQRNRLQTICNLESLQHLQLLSLASNDIMDLRNLTCLVTLKALDVSYNLLDEVPACELPQSLLYLTTEGNPLRKMEQVGAWDEVYALPNLRQHDCEDLYEEEEEEEEEEGGSLCGKDTRDMPAEAAGLELEEGVDSSAIGAEELLDMVHEMGRRRLAAAAQVFEDSMALLRDNRARVFKAQQSELAKDRALQEQLHSQAVRELQEMKLREDELVQAEKAQLAAQLEGSRHGGGAPEHKAFLEEIREADEAGVADEAGPARAGRGSSPRTGAPQRAQESSAKAAQANGVSGVAVPRPDSHVLRSYVDKVDVE